MKRVLLMIACVLLVYNVQAQTVIRQPVNAETVMGLDTLDMVLTTDRNQTILGFKNFTNGIHIGSDVNLYRGGVNTLKTDDGFITGNSLTTQGNLFHYSSINVVNKAVNNWLPWFTRNTSGTEVVGDLNYIGNISMPYTSTISTSSGNLTVGTDGGSSLLFKTNNTPRWYVSTTGAFSPYSSNTYDLGSPSFSIKDIYLVGDISLLNAGSIGTTTGNLTLSSNTANILLNPTTGNIGMFTETPSATLDVNSGNSRFGQGNLGYVLISDDNWGGELGIMTGDDETLALKMDDGTFRYGGSTGSEPLIVKNGYVGIGTTSPTYPLDVQGYAARFGEGSMGYVVIGDDYIGGDLGIYTDEDSPLAVLINGKYQYGGNESAIAAITVDPVGDEGIPAVGINYQEPTEALYVQGNIYATGFHLHGTITGIIASTTQSQGQQYLTTEWNEVSTVGNANDVVTLPPAAAGKECFIVNTGSNTLQIFPASGDNLGAGLDTSTTLAAGASITFAAVNDTNWYSK